MLSAWLLASLTVTSGTLVECHDVDVPARVTRSDLETHYSQGKELHRIPSATHRQASASAVEVEPAPPSLQEARRRWAELLRRIFEVDPLRCSRCAHEMRIVAFITQPRVIDRIHTHLRRIAM